MYFTVHSTYIHTKVHAYIQTYFRVAIKKTRKPPEKDGRHSRHARIHTYIHTVYIHTYLRVAIRKTRKPPEKDSRPDGRHSRHAHIHTYTHLQGPEKLVRTYANKRKNGKSMMMKLEDIREVPAVGPSHRRGPTKRNKVL